MARPGGYTLIEIVVAILIFTIGALALAAGSAVIGRTMTVNGHRDNATRIATSRLERIRAQCHGAGSGADSANGVRSVWNVTTSPSSVKVIETVSYQTPAGMRSETFQASFACP